MEVLPLRPHLSPLFSTSYHLCVYSNPFASKLQVANYEIYYIIVLQSPYKHRKNAALMSHSPKRRFRLPSLFGMVKIFHSARQDRDIWRSYRQFFCSLAGFFANLRGLLYSHSSSSESDGSAAEAASVP